MKTGTRVLRAWIRADHDDSSWKRLGNFADLIIERVVPPAFMQQPGGAYF